MNYITPEQFKALPQAVQDAFVAWWEPQIGDLYFIDDVNTFAPDMMGILNTVTLDYVKDRKQIRKFKPLLQMHHLWDFIEETTGGTIDFIHSEKFSNVSIFIQDKEYRHIRNLPSETLQALLQVAIKITEEKAV